MLQGEAEAGHAHFSGSVRIGGGFRGGVSVHFARPAVRPVFRPRVWVGGRGWWRPWYWPRPYFYYYSPYPYYYEGSPSYYGGSYYPVQPGSVQPGVAAPGVVAVARHREPMPMLGLGVFAGGTQVNGNQDSTELGVLARLRLTDGLLIEGEVAKDTFNGAVSGCGAVAQVCTFDSNGERIDRRIGGSLIWEIGARNALAPYLLAGGGIQQAKVGGNGFVGADFTTTQDFGEVGVGLRLALSRNLHLTADIRAGRRKTIDTNQDSNTVVPLARTINPPTGLANNDTEDYTRGRLAAVLNF